MLLHRLPAALIVHVNRTKWSKGGRKEKLQTHVAFPMGFTGGQLAPHLSPSATAAYVEEGGDGEGVAYRLMAVVCHAGRGTDTGHYTTYGRVEGGDDADDCFALLDDHKVQGGVGAEEVLRSQAFLLFYERV